MFALGSYLTWRHECRRNARNKTQQEANVSDEAARDQFAQQRRQASQQLAASLTVRARLGSLKTNGLSNSISLAF